MALRIDRSDRIKAWLLSMPAFLLYSAVLIYPIIQVFRMSFYAWNGIPASPMRFVGFNNYKAFLTDARFLIALKNVGIFILSGFFVIFPVSLYMATVTQKDCPFKRLFKTCYFIPQVISRTAIALMWYFVLYPDGGPVASLFDLIGLSEVNVNFLGRPETAIYAIVLINAWTYAGYNMLIFSAGLTSIPTELHEAALIDGATSRQAFFRITLPLLRNSFNIFALNCIIGSITTFEMVFVTTNGGPGYASEVFGTLLYKNAFTYNNYGYSNAVGAFLIFTSFIMSVLLTKLFDRIKD